MKKYAAMLLSAIVVGCSPYHYANVKARKYERAHPKSSVLAHRPLPRRKTTPIFRLTPLPPLLELPMQTQLLPLNSPPGPAQPPEDAAKLSASRILAKIYAAGLPQNLVSSASLAAAYSSYSNAVLNGSIKKGKFIVVDFTKKSNMNRLVVVDFETGKFFGAIKVMHGSGSGDWENVQRVSNTPGSYATPGGLLRIHGVNGGSWEGWELEGLERGNSKSRERNILLHPLDIPSKKTSDFPEYLTYGCLGVNDEDARSVGIPVDRVDITPGVQHDWTGRGIFVYFPAKEGKK